MAEGTSEMPVDHVTRNFQLGGDFLGGKVVQPMQHEGDPSLFRQLRNSLFQDRQPCLDDQALIWRVIG